MIYIAHRGNICGKNTDTENNPNHIEAVLCDYEVEIDVWWHLDGFFLGHDYPKYEVSKEFLLKNKLWCHAKNTLALLHLKKLGCHYFWHNTDDYTLTSQGYLWTYPGKTLIKDSIAVLPETCNYDPELLKTITGICSDNIEKYH